MSVTGKPWKDTLSCLTPVIQLQLVAEELLKLDDGHPVCAFVGYGHSLPKFWPMSLLAPAVMSRPGSDTVGVALQPNVTGVEAAPDVVDMACMSADDR